MLTTVEAEIEINGNVRLLEPVKISRRSRAIVTILDDEPPKTNGETNKMFGMWQGREITREEYLKLDHNERIDFDLAKSYYDAHEDEN